MNYEVLREILTAQIQSDVYSGQRDTQQFEGKKKKLESNTSTDLIEHIFNLLKTKLKAEGITKRQLQETRGVT